MIHKQKNFNKEMGALVGQIHELIMHMFYDGAKVDYMFAGYDELFDLCRGIKNKQV